MKAILTSLMMTGLLLTTSPVQAKVGPPMPAMAQYGDVGGSSAPPFKAPSKAPHRASAPPPKAPSKGPATPPPTVATTPVHTAALAGDLDALKAAAGTEVAKLQARDGNGSTPLHLAAWKGRVEVVGYLIESGCDVNPTDSIGATPLFLAVSSGQAEAATRLLGSGADPNLANREGQTPLHKAAAAGNLVLVKLLVDKGARTDLKDRSGQTPAALAEHFRQAEFEMVLDSFKKLPPPTP